MKDYIYIYTHAVMWSQIQLSPALIAVVWGRMMCSASGGGWENYWMVWTCVHCTFLHE